MSKSRAFRVACVASMVACLAALAPGARADRVHGSLEISFSATSTLHEFSGSVPALAVAIEQGPGGGWSGDVDVPVASLGTGIARRDENMRAMLDAAQHPRIRGRFRDLGPEQVHASGVLPFLLQIRDVERSVQATVSHWQQDDRSARFDAEFDVSLREFALEAPRVLFVRVDDQVHVTVHVTLARS
ncbi:MAG: YceI-like domain [Deltaproteobacteria bacterium]|nr:YceI-like domain [Deltaproteobacteria bacterium]